MVGLLSWRPIPSRIMARRFRLLLHLDVGDVTGLGREREEVLAGIAVGQKGSSICDDRNGTPVVDPAQEPPLRSF